MTEKFDFNEALKAIQSGQVINGKDGVLAPSKLASTIRCLQTGK